MLKKLYISIYSNLNIKTRKFINKGIKSVIKQPKVKLIDESIEEIINRKSSISRFGDGELWIICGGIITYQEADVNLRKRLKEILVSESKNHIVAIPDVFTDKRLSLRTNENIEFWNNHLKKHRVDWYLNLNLKKQYYNTAISRFYIPIRNKEYSKKCICLLKQIWDKKEIVIIEGKGSRLGV